MTASAFAAHDDAGGADRSVNVMLVDDSAVIRGLFRRMLEAEDDIHVVATAGNGQAAIDAIKRHDVDVVVLDIEMPVMDGLTALPELLKCRPGVKVLIASTLTEKNADVSLRAMSMGAADYVAKPSSVTRIQSGDEFQREVRSKVLVLGRMRRRGQRLGRAAVGVKPAAPKVAQPAATHDRAPIALRRAVVQRPKAVAIGASTGGPNALFEVFKQIGSHIHLPIFVTQHMPPTFTKVLADRLGKVSGLAAAEAVDGEPIAAGRLYVAPGDFHMLVEGNANSPRIKLSAGPAEHYCRPAVDPMLRALSEVYGSGLLVAILTGMGSDGASGAEVVAAAGGQVMAQDEETSVVWGMPGATAATGVCSAVLPLDKVGGRLLKVCGVG